MHSLELVFLPEIVDNGNILRQKEKHLEPFQSRVTLPIQHELEQESQMAVLVHASGTIFIPPSLAAINGPINLLEFMLNRKRREPFLTFSTVS